jgi:hypothetical protein
MTWKGFFIKNREKDGWVEVSSENDIAIFKEGLEEPKIKVGRLGLDKDGNMVYGIKIADNEGKPVLITEDDGSLWLKDKLSIGTYNNNEVQIGKLDTEISKDETHGGRVIDANGDFVVYEDGHMKATSGEFTGTIIATGGKIGNITIGEVEGTVSSSKKFDIISELGYNFKVSGGVGSPT